VRELQVDVRKPGRVTVGHAFPAPDGPRESCQDTKTAAFEFSRLGGPGFNYLVLRPAPQSDADWFGKPDDHVGAEREGSNKEAHRMRGVGRNGEPRPRKRKR